VSAENGQGTAEELEARLERVERAAAARQRQLERYAADLREVFKRERASAQELRASYMATVRALSNAVEARDAYTGKHAERVAAYGVELARRIGLDVSTNPQVEFGFLLHDVGKVAIPDAILFKPDRLTDEEYALIARHPVIGAEILRDVTFLGEAKLVVRHHHERWDGTGYVDRLAGTDIPYIARILAVSDAFSAMTTTRPYRKALDVAEALRRLEDAAGTQLDEKLVVAFVHGIETVAGAPLPGMDAPRIWTPYASVA
jgi:ribonuclease P protein subunit RPR2